MKRLYPCFFLICSLVLGSLNFSNAQIYQLLAEDFETGAPTVILNDSGPGGIVGNNRWIINNEFDGLGIYPNTISQDSTVSGTIGGAPFSTYMHIHDVAAAGTSNVSNANYDPANASDNFAIIASGLCTKGFTDVTLAFFYISEGNATDFGSLYYSADNGPWTQVGQGAYNNQPNWKYEVLTDPGFNDVTSLRFGFRWQNASGAPPSNTSFGIDDIEIIGTYDSITNPININITSVTPDTVCQNNLLFVFWQLTDSLCDAFYEVELSDAAGTFFNPTSLGVFTIANFQTSGAVAVIIPSTTPAGTCYKIRINRVSPPPAITGIASICFVVNFCPNTVTTLQPPVTLDTNGVCIGSVIDIPFYSTGVFVFNNYIAELSDSAGNFTSPTFIGSSFDDNAYDPSLGSPPGNVGGLVPNVPPGCNYYVRVRATSPATIGSVWGPFCIVQCDIKTNRTKDLQFCINSTTGADTLIYVDIHTFDSVAVYAPGNQFEIQVLDAKTLALVNQGGLGFLASTTNDSFFVSVPPLPQLLLLGIAPGAYYCRIVATGSSTPDNSLGTIIHLKIGAPNDIPPDVIPSDSLFCTGDIGSFYINPYNFNSQYQWWCNGINSGQPFFWDYYPLLVQYGGPGTLYVTVREWNYGCPGPVSDSAKVVVLTVPNVFITGPVNVCKGDTVHYKVSFAPNTFYSWTNTSGTITDTANNEIDIVFDSVGTFQVSIFGLNQCGSDTGFRNIFVYDVPLADAGPDTSICAGSSINLSTLTGTGYSYSWSNGSSVIGTTNPINVTPSDTTTYYLQVALTPGACRSYDTVVVNIAQPLNNAVFSDSACTGETLLLDPNVVNGTSYQWSNGATTAQISVNNTGTYTVLIEVPGEICDRLDSFYVYHRDPQSTYYNDSLCIGDTIVLDPGQVTGNYLWNTGETTQQISISASGNYAVAISVADNPCYRADTFSIQTVLPGTFSYIDSLCVDSAITLNATVPGGTYVWNTGATGVQLLVQDTGIYFVTINAPGLFCYQQDTFVVVEKICPKVELSFILPNVFTPNNDGFNDNFQAITKGDYDEFSILIYNRWGELVFESSDSRFEWNGDNLKGKPCSDGVYFYVAKTVANSVSENYSGPVTLIRDSK